MKTLGCEAVARAALGEPLKCEGPELLYKCPRPQRHANGDVHPSLKINTKKNVWACFPCGAKGKAWALAAFLARCDSGDKSAAIGWLKKHGLLKGTQPTAKADGRGPVVATFVHEDADGNPICRKLRHEPGAGGREKDYTWERFEGGRWKPGLGNPAIVPPLYRLPRIKAERLIFLFESHTDVECAVGMGLPATTSGGTDSWRSEYTDALAGKDVCLIPDNNVAGARYEVTVCSSLTSKVRSLKIVLIAPYADFRRWVGAGGTRDKLLAIYEAAPEWKPAQGCEILDSVLRFVRQFVSLTDSQARVLALWVAHTHALKATDFTPYLSITSAEKESGKTRVLEVLKFLVAEPWFTGRVSAAVLVRKIDAEQPTLLLDESDAAFGSEREYAEALRGVLDTGYQRGGVSSCCVGQGANISYKDFSTFCPKAIVGIGKLPDTVASRSIPIRLKRAYRGTVPKLRQRDGEQETAELRARLAAWCGANLDRLRSARPEIPERLSDRQADCCEPLLAIADLAGADWPEIARRALVELSCAAQEDDQSIGIRLLTDIRAIFEARGVERLSSADLAAALGEIETSPWGEWSHGKPITAPKLARLLRPFGVTPHNIRLSDGKVPKGYCTEDFADVWSLYLPPETTLDTSPTPDSPVSKRYAATTRINTGENSDFETATKAPCSGSENAQSPSEDAPCSGVAVSKAPRGVEEEL